jgi:hypothetical protein
MIGKFQFSVPNGNTGLLSFQQVAGLTMFSRLLFSQLFVHHAVFNSAVFCLLFNIIFERSCTKHLNRYIRFWTGISGFEQAYQVHFPDTAVPNKLRKSTVPLFADFIGICWNGFSYGTRFNICCNYECVIITLICNYMCIINMAFSFGLRDFRDTVLTGWQ